MASDFTIRDVLEWARTKPADERYDATDAGNCALGQFLRTNHGFTEDECLRDDPFFEKGFDKRLASALVCCSTFGELVVHLEALCPSEWTKLDTYLTDIEAVAADRERVA